MISPVLTSSIDLSGVIVGLMMMTCVWVLKDISRPFRGLYRKKKSPLETLSKRTEVVEADGKEAEPTEDIVNATESSGDSSEIISEVSGNQEVSRLAEESQSGKEGTKVGPLDTSKEEEQQADGISEGSDEREEFLGDDAEMPEGADFSENDSGGLDEDGEAASDETGEA